MSGIFENIQKDYKGVWAGTTHGCGCCADTSPITTSDVQNHIEQLQEDLDKAREILAQMETEKKLSE